MTKTITSGEVVEKWDALISDITHDGDEVVVMVDGVPVLKLVPFDPSPRTNDGPMAGSVTHEDDIISPIDVEWEAAK